MFPSPQERSSHEILFDETLQDGSRRGVAAGEPSAFARASTAPGGVADWPVHGARCYL